MDKGLEYIKALQANTEKTNEYYRKSIVKTEQQKFLERLLRETGRNFSNVADVACGGGTLTYHLRALFPDAVFTLLDFNEEALGIAKEFNGSGCTYIHGNIYDLKDIPSECFDLVCCWQTLSWLDNAEKALQELLRITEPGGYIYISSLFNIRHDVDIFAKLVDHTREGSEEFGFSYNTYSSKLLSRWLDGKVKGFNLHEFNPGIDLHFADRGLGTYTIKTDTRRLQVSAGYMMNWAVLEIIK